MKKSGGGRALFPPMRPPGIPAFGSEHRRGPAGARNLGAAAVLTIALQPYKSLVNFVEFHNPGVAMSQRDQALIADWESRPLTNALAVCILGQLNERKAEVERCALDGLRRENQQFERAASPQFRAEAFGHCNDILKSMLAIASGSARAQGDDPFHFVASHAVRRARQQFPLAGSLNAYRFAHRGYWEVMRNSVLSAPAVDGEKSDCLMLLSVFLLEFFDRISGIMTDAYIAEEKRVIARRTHVALVEDLLHGRQPVDLETQDLCERTGIGSSAAVAIAIARIGPASNGGLIDRAAELDRLSEIFRKALAPEKFSHLIDIRKDEVLAIVASGAETAKLVAKAFCEAAEQPGNSAKSRNQPQCAGNIGAAAGLSGGRARGRVRDEDPADHAFCRNRPDGIPGAASESCGAAADPGLGRPT